VWGRGETRIEKRKEGVGRDKKRDQKIGSKTKTVILMYQPIATNLRMIWLWIYTFNDRRWSADGLEPPVCIGQPGRYLELRCIQGNRRNSIKKRALTHTPSHTHTHTLSLSLTNAHAYLAYCISCRIKSSAAADMDPTKKVAPCGMVVMVPMVNGLLTRT